MKERLAHEKALLGFYLSGHPLDRYRLDVQSFSNCPTGSLAQKNDGQEVLWLGMLTRIQPRVDKNGNAWAIAEGEDYEGSLELKFWSKTYERVRDLLEPDALIAVRGRISRWGGATQIEALDAQPIEEIRKARCVSIRVEWDAGRMSQKAARSARIHWAQIQRAQTH